MHHPSPTSNPAAGNLLFSRHAGALDARHAIEVVDLHPGQVLCRGDESVEHVFFVDCGLVTLVGGTSDGQTVEVATVGREGIVGAVACLGLNALPFEARVQVGGMARRLKADLVCEELGKAASPLSGIVLRYLQYEVCQLTQSTTCSRFHTSSERVAKWLLLAAQRLESHTLPLTHEAIAHLVGGPRHEVSRDLARLHDAGAVRRRRGRLEVVDAEVLRAHACECVGRIETAYARLLAFD